MFRKIFALCIGYYALVIVLAGCYNDCNCNSYPDRTIRWSALRLVNQEYKLQSNGTVDIISDTSTDFSGRQLMLRAILDFDYVASSRLPVSFSLVNVAYACDCVDPVLRAENKITGIRIFSLTDFDVTHPAGSEVTDAFGSLQYTANGGASIGTLQLDLSSQYYGYIPQVEYDFYLVRRPVAGSLQQFKLDVHFMDGSSYMAETPVLRF